MLEALVAQGFGGCYDNTISHKLAIVDLGGEPFMHYAQPAPEYAPDKHMVCACCVNGYEATGTPFTKGLEADCIAAVREMLSRF